MRAGDAWPRALLHAVMLCAACTLVLALGPQGVAFDSEKPPAFVVGRCHCVLVDFAAQCVVNSAHHWDLILWFQAAV